MLYYVYCQLIARPALLASYSNKRKSAIRDVGSIQKVGTHEFRGTFTCKKGTLQKKICEKVWSRAPCVPVPTSMSVMYSRGSSIARIETSRSILVCFFKG